MLHRDKWSVIVMMMVMMMMMMMTLESIRNVGSHLRLLLPYILEDFESVATPLREPGFLQNLDVLIFEVVREVVCGDTMADETG